GDGGTPEQIELRQAAQLIDALKEKRELGRERETRHVVIESCEERIVVRLLEQFVGGKAQRELARKARLAGADRSFDHDVAAGSEIHARQKSVRCARVRAMRCARTPGRKRLAGPRPGIVTAGMMSVSGCNTKARSCMRGCGTVRRGE